jgi:hypothetical protein
MAIRTEHKRVTASRSGVVRPTLDNVEKGEVFTWEGADAWWLLAHSPSGYPYYVSVACRFGDPEDVVGRQCTVEGLREAMGPVRWLMLAKTVDVKITI